jgi:hypothetical protein
MLYWKNEAAMTRQSKKKFELFWAEEAAKLLGRPWKLDSSEHPDFIVTEAGMKFGLEVCDVFTAPNDETEDVRQKKGSTMKMAESIRQQAVDNLRREYEAITNTPLAVKLVGNTGAENLALVVPALVKKDLQSKQIGYHEVIDTDTGLRVHVTRNSSRAEWYDVGDRAGFVDRNPLPRLETAIEEKSQKLPEYRQGAGPDIRLLLVANRINNSGKLVLETPAKLDRKGFEVVYFFSYPESLTVFDCAGTQVIKYPENKCRRKNDSHAEVYER